METRTANSQLAALDAVAEHAGHRVEELPYENARLQEALRSPAVGDRGYRRHRRPRAPDTGPELGCLRGISKATDIKLRHVSELIVDWARTGQLCSDIRTAFGHHAPASG